MPGPSQTPACLSNCLSNQNKNAQNRNAYQTFEPAGVRARDAVPRGGAAHRALAKLLIKPIIKPVIEPLIKLRFEIILLIYIIIVRTSFIEHRRCASAPCGATRRCCARRRPTGAATRARWASRLFMVFIVVGFQGFRVQGFRVLGYRWVHVGYIRLVTS